MVVVVVGHVGAGGDDPRARCSANAEDDGDGGGGGGPGGSDVCATGDNDVANAADGFVELVARW